MAERAVVATIVRDDDQLLDTVAEEAVGQLDVIGTVRTMDDWRRWEGGRNHGQIDDAGEGFAGT